MCGIVGILGETRPSLAEAMLGAIAHRGRDDRRWRCFDGFGTLGINRLSIIDVERGEQPIFNEDGTLAVVCNGEIYNHRAIRRDLRDEHDFATSSDVEARVPFLDRDFVEYAFNLPSDAKIKESDGRRIEKWHLRESFAGLLPDELVWREKCPFDREAVAGP